MEFDSKSSIDTFDLVFLNFLEFEILNPFISLSMVAKTLV